MRKYAKWDTRGCLCALPVYVLVSSEDPDVTLMDYALQKINKLPTMLFDFYDSGTGIVLWLHKKAL